MFTLTGLWLAVRSRADRRFTTKLLSERRDGTPGSSLGRIVTPH